MSDRDFDEYIREREARRDFRAAFEDYYGRDTKETRKDRIALDDGCAWLRINEGDDESE